MSKIDTIIQQKNMISTYPNRGITITRGKGVYLYDDEGRKYLDMTSNFGVNVFGYNHPQINQALKKQINNLVNLHGSFISDVRSKALTDLTKMLSESGFKNLKRIYWGSSGAEAIEAAIKFAILATGKNKFIAAKNAYHGKTFGALSATTSGAGKYQKPFKPNLLKIDPVEFGDFASLEKTISKEHAALILEPVQGEGGFIFPPKDYFPRVSKLCREKGVLLIMDEIQSGMGRTGRFLNSQQYVKKGFGCDILCLAKGLGGGVPVSATITTEEINSKIPRGIHTSTFGGNPLSMAGVIASLELIKNSDILGNAGSIGSYFIQQLKSLKIGKEVRGKGLMIGIEMDKNPLPIIKKLQDEGILAAPSSGNTIRFLPPLIIKKPHVDLVIEKFKKCADS